LSALVSFTEVTYSHEGSSKWDKMKVMAALRVNVMALSHMHETDITNEAVKVEMTLLINQLLDTIKQTKEDLNMSGWIHKHQDSEEYQYYKLMCGDYEAYSYGQLGAMLMSVSNISEESFKIMITHYKKAIAISNLVGMKDRANNLNSMILVLTAKKTIC
jgi:hypothetical protein